MLNGVNGTNGFEGTQTAPVNAGQQPATTPVQQPQVATPAQTQTPAVTPGTVTGQTQAPQIDEFGHRIRSALSQQEAQFRQQNQAALELAATLQQMGRDPNQVLQQVREAHRQAQLEAQQQAAQGMGVSPQLLQQMQAMQQQVESVQRTVGEQKLAEAERNLTTFAAQYGIDYNDPQTRMEVRQFALDNNVNLDTAFKAKYFERILQVNSQNAQGQAIAAMQGRGPQLPSTAVPGNTNAGPTDYLKMTDAEFEKAARDMRAGYYQR